MGGGLFNWPLSQSIDYGVQISRCTSRFVGHNQCSIACVCVCVRVVAVDSEDETTWGRAGTRIL